MDSNRNEIADTFEEMSLKRPLLQRIYSYGLEKPSRIQKKGIKQIILGCDIFAQELIKTGKTTAFIIGMLELINTSVLQC